MKTIYLHLGPPKTGTTSLQRWLVSNKGDAYTYAGSRQPRVKYDKKDLSHAIYKWAKTEFPDALLKKKLRSRIETRLKKSDHLILSEEMFLHRPRWQRNIENLKDILDGYQVKISICIRELRAVIPSYFAETYFKLPESLRDDYEAFSKSKWVGMYHPESVYGCLLNIGFNPNDIHFFLFKDLTNERLTLNEIFDVNVSDERWNTKITLAHDNKKSVGKEKDARGSKYYTIAPPKSKKGKKRKKKIVGALKKLGLTWDEATGDEATKITIALPHLPHLDDQEIQNDLFLKSKITGA